MENGIMSFTAEEGLDITATNFDALIAEIEHSDDLCLIKSSDHKFAYVNKVFRHYHDVPQNYNVEGKYIGEVPTYLADFQEVIHAGENKVISGKQRVPFIVNAIYGGKNKITQPFAGQTMPLINRQGVPVGLIVRARKLALFTMDNIISNRQPDTIQFGNPSALFSNREFEVVFYVLQRLRAQEIAERMFLAVRTVENHIQTIYEKAGVSGPTARYQFIAWCRDKGYDRYVPEKFISVVPIQFYG